MNSISKASITPQDSLNRETAPFSTEQSQRNIESVAPSHHAAVGDSPSNLAFGDDSKNLKLPHVTVAGAQDISSTSRSEIKITGKDLRECIEGVVQQLTPFFIPCDQNNASKIPVLDKKGERIEFHDNRISAEAGDLALEASHEMAKERFVTHLILLYGKPVIDCFYPEETRKVPLTLLQMHLLREQLNQFHQDIETACSGDPSKYHACWKAQLESLQKLESTVTTVLEGDSTLKSQVDAITASLAKQLGVTPETIQTCVVAGLAFSAVAAAAATGVGLPAALHVATTSAMTSLAHSAGASALPMMGASLKGVATTAGVAHSSVPAAVSPYRALEIAVATILGGTGLGALGGLAVGSTIAGLNWSRGGNMEVTGEEMRGYVFGGAAVGFWMSFGGSLFGPSALHVGVAHPATWGLYGAEIGGAIGSVATGIVAGVERWNEEGTFPNAPSANNEESLHAWLHHYFPESREFSPGAQIALITVAGGVIGGTALGAEAAYAGGLAQWSAHYAAQLTAAAGGN